jgi:hypothetical protein
MDEEEEEEEEEDEDEEELFVFNAVEGPPGIPFCARACSHLVVINKPC